MDNPPLDRHPALQPLSRDHYYALVQAKHLHEAAGQDAEARRQALEAFIQEWDREIRAHFDDEERLLLEVISPSHQKRLVDEHTAMRALVSDARKLAEPFADEAAPAWVAQLGQLLHDHTQWEEREVFPAIEQSAGAAKLARIGAATAAIEATRKRR